VRPPAIRIRSLMLVVAAAALAVWGTLAWQRMSRLSKFYARQALEHEWGEAITEMDIDRIMYEQNDKGHLVWVERDFKKADLDLLRARARREGDLKRAYRRAARYPWLRADPDPGGEYRMEVGWPIKRSDRLSSGHAH